MEKVDSYSITNTCVIPYKKIAKLPSQAARDAARKISPIEKTIQTQPIGYSFLVPFKDYKNGTSLRNLMNRFAKKYDMEFIVRQRILQGGYRVWRIR